MRFVCLLVLLSPLVAFGGDFPAGAACSNPNQCLSKTCHQKRCDGSSDHPGGTGAFCRSNGHCKSRNCAINKCAAPKAEKPRSTSPTTGGKRPVEEVEEEEEAVKAPTPEPLPEPTPCSEDLMATVYKKHAGSRAYLFAARDDCKYYKPEIIEQAKKVFLEGYGYNFGVTLRTVKEATPEQLACAKKQYDLPKNGVFEVPRLCLGKAELIACTDELATLFVAHEDMKPEMARSQAQIECENRAPSVVARAKPLLIEKYGHFGHICDTIEKATPEQVECVKRDYVIRTDGRTKYSSFTLQGVCLTDDNTWGCYFDVLEGVLKDKRTDDRFRSDLESACRRTTPEDLALAKQIHQNGWTGYFPSLLSSVRDVKPEKRACLKKNYMAMPYKDSFYLPKVCEKK